MSTCLHVRRAAAARKVIEDVFRGMVEAMTTDRFQELERRYVRTHDGHWALPKAFTTHVLPAPQSDVVLPSPSPTRLGLLRSRVARLRQHVGPRTMGRLCTCSRPCEQYRREPLSRTCHDVPATAGGGTRTQRESVCE
jgi:hypothetical protein